MDRCRWSLCSESISWHGPAYAVSFFKWDGVHFSFLRVNILNQP
jgi:hypothetical protein